MGGLTIALGSDHAGFAYKEKMKQTLKRMGHHVLDNGTFGESSVDYPDFAHPVATAVENGEAQWGILFCGSGNGVAITANKHAGIRAALCWKEELARLARAHNDANVLCVPARFVSLDLAKKMIKAFLSEPFEGGRHLNRVQKITC